MKAFISLFAVVLGVLLSGAATAPSSTGTAEREFSECDTCPVMVGIPGGRFVMGSPDAEAGRFDTEGPLHPVSVEPFALGKYPVTSKEFLFFLKDTGYQPAPCIARLNMGWRSPSKGVASSPAGGVEPPLWPAVCLGWRDADAYVAWLNKRAHTARPELGARPGPYRLPSEAEWEYAARAGTTTARWWGEDIGKGNTNCNGCGSRYDFRVLADVDAFKPNAFGLYGMLGNAWQWIADCWHESYVGAPLNGAAWMEGDCTRHVIRGGSWSNVPSLVRAAARAGSGLNDGEFDYSALAGFRVARDLP